MKAYRPLYRAAFLAVVATVVIPSASGCKKDADLRGDQQPPAPAPLTWCDERPGASCLPATCRGNERTLVDVRADWCPACQAMERETFRDPDVVRRLSRMGLVRIDVDVAPDAARAFRAEVVPTIVVLDGQCREVGRIRGALPPDGFLSELDAMERRR